MTNRFTYLYNLVGPCVSLFAAFAMLFLLYSVIKQVLFDVSLFTVDASYVTSLAILWISSILIVMMKVASIYLLQQSHLRALDDAHVHICFSAAAAAERKGVSHLAAGSDGIAPDAARMVQAMKTRIEGERDAPNILGISVKPTFFYVMLGYVGASIAALSGKYVSGL